jgi:hypothetical protein
MTDQPIIYWQDEPTDPFMLLKSPDPLRPQEVCQLVMPGNPTYNTHLTRDQARALGYALIARATVTSGEHTDAWTYWHQAVHNNNYEPETAWYALDPE